MPIISSLPTLSNATGSTLIAVVDLSGPVPKSAKASFSQLASYFNITQFNTNTTVSASLTATTALYANSATYATSATHASTATYASTSNNFAVENNLTVQGLTSSTSLFAGDSNSFVSLLSGNSLKIGGSNNMFIGYGTSGAVNINPAADVSIGLTGQTVYIESATLESSADVYITSTTTSIETTPNEWTRGALTVEGDAGFNSNIRVRCRIVQDGGVTIGCAAGSFYDSEVPGRQFSLNDVAIGTLAGACCGDWGIAIGHAAGYRYQHQGGIAIGFQAGYVCQYYGAVAIGWGGTGQCSQGTGSVAIGNIAGNFCQAAGSIAIGQGAGANYLTCGSIAIGCAAGWVNDPLCGPFPKGCHFVAIGYQAGALWPNSCSVSIGTCAGFSNAGYGSVSIGVCSGVQNNYGVAVGACSYVDGAYGVSLGYKANADRYRDITYSSIVLNATGLALNATTTGTYIAPIRYDSSNTDQAVYYNISTKELTYTTPTGGGGGGTWPIGHTYGSAGPLNIAIGCGASLPTTGNTGTIAIGVNAGCSLQSDSSIAIGRNAGTFCQNCCAIAIGVNAGTCCQSTWGVALGTNAGQISQGNYSVAVGYGAGNINQSTSTIILNATGQNISGISGQNNSFYVAPVRADSSPSNVLHYNTSTYEITYGVSNGGGGLPSRTTANVTTVSLAAGSSTTATITGFKGYALYSIQTSAAAWVTLYSSIATRTADSARPITQDPTPGSGVIAEVITVGSATQYFSPAAMGYSSEATPSTGIPVKIYNNGVTSSSITVTLTLLQMEA